MGERHSKREGGQGVDPEKRDRDEWQIPVRNGQKTEKEEAGTVVGTGRSRQKKKRGQTSTLIDFLSILLFPNFAG